MTREKMPMLLIRRYCLSDYVVMGGVKGAA